MAGYELLIKPSALKELESVPGRGLRRRIAARIGALAGDPRPSGCIKLTGGDRYRLRCGAWRIIYSVEDRAQTVTVVKLGLRKDIYR